MARPTARVLNLVQPALGAACGGRVKTAAGAALPPVRVHFLREPIPYPIGLKLQNDIIDARLAARARDPARGKSDVLLLLEHTPTYTTGRRDNSPNPDQLHPEEQKVQHVGADFYITKRGGQVTYHGPGQLVGYPILDLNAMETPTRCYVEYLQALLADYVREEHDLDVLAPHPDGHVGVFSTPTEKMASIGIHLRHRITSHGFALNVTPEPIPWFDLVTACGLADVRAVSLHALLDRLGPGAGAGAGSVGGTLASPRPAVRDVAAALVPRFQDVFARRFVPLASDADAASGERADVDAVRQLVEQAEEDAARANQAQGGWPAVPDLSRRE
ncbi:hypothetical protein Q5752_004586 [Cryptotrichosporon argae]